MRIGLQNAVQGMFASSYLLQELNCNTRIHSSRNTDPKHSKERCRAAVHERLLLHGARHAMRQRELEVLGHELLDVRPPQVLRLLQLDEPEDLQSLASSRSGGQNERGST